MSAQRHPSLRSRFRDLDARDVYDEAVREAQSDNARNFVVEFNFQEAHVAFDLNADEFGILLDQKPPEGIVRWINIWSPSTQRPSVERIGTHYGFSHRLQALMTSPAKLSPGKFRPAQTFDPSDIEVGLAPSETKALSPSEVPPQALEDVEVYQLVKETMNYTSIDYGRQFLCIGANWLHRRPAVGKPGHKKTLLPPKHWSWLTLCSDSVVLSLHEAPPYEQPDSTEWVLSELKSMRSNTSAVLHQLSDHGVDEYRDRVVTLKSVRKAFPTESAGNLSVHESASNLFFYLFEDYSGAVPVLKASRSEIKTLRDGILTSNSRRSKLETGDVIRPLHTLRSELRQLQHLFESYKSLIRRLTRIRSVDGHWQCSCDAQEMSDNHTSEVKIAPSARGRFERLEDRLQLLMLNTIQEYLDELNALSSTYFNLTAQKDSQATARLSRSATLLAKLSVFFLPISFMTSYFSVEIPDLVEHYTPKMYWICFAVIAGISFLSLFFFSRLLELLIDVLEGWSDSVWKRFFDKRDERDDH